MSAIENALHDLLDVVSGHKAHLSPSEADAHHAAITAEAEPAKRSAEQLTEQEGGPANERIAEL